MPHSILVACPQASDATSFYRGIGPFSDLARRFPEIVSFEPIGSKIDWYDIARFSICFLQRPFTREHLEVLSMAKSYGIPVWVDYDDDMFNVPLSNNAFHAYMDPRTQAVVLEFLKNADVITVSTEQLAKSFKEKLPKEYHLKIRVINNAWPDTFFGSEMRPVNEGKKVFFWRGSATHQEDIEDHLGDFKALADHFTDWKFHFLGEPNPVYKLLRVIPRDRIRVISPVHITAFFSMMKTLDVGVSLVPLTDNVFNRSKSNIASMEAIFGGAISVAPAWDEWNGIGSGLYKHGEVSMAEAASLAIETWQHTAMKQRELLQTKYLLSTVNEARMEIIYQLIGDR